MNTARSPDPEACERCGVQKATQHLEFAYSGPWNMCAPCAGKVTALHPNRGKPKGTGRGRHVLAPLSQRPYTPERRTVTRIRSQPWSPEERARKARRVA